jgi:hypothetical protein
MITKYEILKELKQRIADGYFVNYIVEEKKGDKLHMIRFGSGIMISIAGESRSMYINFSFNRNEKDEVLELLKNAKPIIKNQKKSFFKRLFSKSE